MASDHTFTPPDFVENNTANEIHQRMMNNLPDDIDDMPGGFPYDFTMPTALEKSELIQYHLVRTLMLMFPQFAWGEWLEYHAQQIDLVRKSATYATGEVLINGVTDTEIPAQFAVCSATTGTESAIVFYTNEGVVIPESGSVTVSVTAAISGTASNVKANTITMMLKPLNGISELTNPEPMTGGTEAESDEDLRERVMEEYASKGMSYVGNDSDYKRWAKEVDGVGDVVVISEEPGTVKLIIMDSNGDPANDALLEAVYNYIYSPDEPDKRKSPTGVTLIVSAPEIVYLTLCCTATLESGYTAQEVTEAFEAGLLDYYKATPEEGIIKLKEIEALLINTAGVYDFVNLTINGQAQNIEISKYQYPQTVSVDLGIV